jgi:hypothetical protein
MPLSHLLMGLLGAAIAFAAAMLLGWEFWAALLAYVVVGNAVFLGGVALDIAVGRLVAARARRRAAPQRERAPVRPAPVRGSSLAAAQAVAGSASRARPAMAAKASGS